MLKKYPSSFSFSETSAISFFTEVLFECVFWYVVFINTTLFILSRDLIESDKSWEIKWFVNKSNIMDMFKLNFRIKYFK